MIRTCEQALDIIKDHPRFGERFKTGELTPNRISLGFTKEDLLDSVTLFFNNDESLPDVELTISVSNYDLTAKDLDIADSLLSLGIYAIADYYMSMAKESNSKPYVKVSISKDYLFSVSVTLNGLSIEWAKQKDGNYTLLAKDINGNLIKPKFMDKQVRISPFILFDYFNTLTLDNIE